jgi:predicted Zn finger-like uncharacterized protein
MLTRCPDCATVFRITPDQLKARQGKVRCGECQCVFNALDSLVEELATTAPVVPAPTPVPPAEVARAETGEAPARSGDVEPVSISESEPESEPESPAASSHEEILASIGAETPHSLPAVPSDTSVAPEPLVAPPRPFSVPPYPSPRRRRWPWALGLLVALLVLMVQVLVHFRVEMAVLQPGLKPLLQGLCRPLGCDLPLPHRAEMLGIETSDLHPDPTHPGRLQLVMTLRNRAPFVQELPHLEVTLTDTADATLLVRSLAPREYLPAGTDPGRGFAAGSELPVNLTLDVGDVPAAGYRLYLYFP